MLLNLNNLSNNSAANKISLLANDAYFKTLAETIPHILFIIDPENYRLQYINRLQPGFTLESVVGKDMFEFVLPSHIHVYKEKISETKLSKKTTIFELEGDSNLHPQGKAWYRAHISILPDQYSKISSLMIIAEDITEKKLKEIEIINRGEKLKAIINNTNDIICSIDLNYKLTEFNSVFVNNVRKNFKKTLESGMDIFQFIDIRRHHHLKTIFERVELGEAFFDEESYINPQGKLVYYETYYHPIFNNKREVFGISIFSKDITERVKNEQKIKNNLKEKEVLLAEIHHRIKNNLAMVSGMLQLQEMNISNAEAKEALSLSRKRIKSTALIHELLYRNETFQKINISDYIIELYNQLKINDNIKIQLKGESVKVDLTIAMPLGLMLNEIMLNSFKHSYKNAKEGRTEISTNLDQGYLIINYCDCVGVFPDSIDFKNTSTTGLTLIHTFIEQLNGEIDLISKAPPQYLIKIPLDEK